MLDSFKVDTRQQDSIWIFSTYGYINNLGGEAIAKNFNEKHAAGGRKFLFDLAGSKIINSIGVSYLIEILEKILESKGELAFCNCAPIIEKTFKIMGITQYTKIFGTLDEAMNHMREKA
ncbi:MAG: STAS domain-containing protein [bacterium]|nr:MAG: STAS domain-containing protein [bacterium]